MSTVTPSWQVACLALLGTLLVGAIDLVTGSDVQVTALYFVPLTLAGMRLPLRGAIAMALVAAAVWLGAESITREHPVSLGVAAANFLLQGLAFTVVTLLVARLNHSLQRERSLGRIDMLTGLHNRRSLLEHAQRLLQRGRRSPRPVALALIDLDHFKSVNDRAGHRRGDQLLARCGQLIASVTRTSDIAARIGGDEFALLLPDTDAAAAREACARLQRAFDEAAELSEWGVGASIGLSVDADGCVDIDTLLARADAAMYLCKSAKAPMHRSGAGLRHNPRAPAVQADDLAGVDDRAVCNAITTMP